MHFQEAKTILTPQNGINIYRGCTNNCMYCHARNKKNRISHDFDDVCVKICTDDLLWNMLKKKRAKGMIFTGVLADPYMDIEGELKNIRKCLKVIERFDFGVVIQTKNKLILRDLDILKEINKKTKCVITIPLSTTDSELSKKLEPQASSADERIEVIKALSEAGINWILNIDTIIPRVNDTVENINALLDIAKKYGAYGIEHNNMILTMADGIREYFFENLKVNFPEISDELIADYGDFPEIITPNKVELMSIISKFCDDNGIVRDQEEIIRFKRVYTNNTQGQQLSLFDL